MFPVPEFKWDGTVRSAQVQTETLAWDAPVVQHCLQEHDGTPVQERLQLAQSRAAAQDPAGLKLTHLVSPAQAGWPGCRLRMGEAMAQGASGAVRLGFLEHAVGDWPAGLVAVKEMHTRPVLAELDWDPACAGAASRPASGSLVSGMSMDIAVQAPESAASPFAQAALQGSSSSTSSAASRTFARQPATLECRPERIVEEAECQRTFSPHKLPVLALLQDETTGVHYLVMRWMRGGSLHNAALHKLSGRYLGALGRLVVHSIAHDLNRLSPGGMPPEERVHYPAGVAHDDIKPLNFLFDRDTVALGDWDVDRRAASQQDGIPSTGTPRYMAPERFPFGLPSVASDMWSLGVSVVELFSGKESPFAQAERSQPAEGQLGHARFEAFYAALFAGNPMHKVDRAAFETQLNALEASYPVTVQWLRPMWKADPRLCVFVLRNLLNPDPAGRLKPGQILARREELFPPSSTTTMAQLRKPSHAAAKWYAEPRRLPQILSGALLAAISAHGIAHA